MRRLRQQIETWFAALGHLVYRRRWWALLLMVLMTVPMLLQLRRLTFDTRTESFFLESDDTLRDYNAFRDQFGMDEFIIVAINPPEVFDLPFLTRLRDLHRDLEASVPYIAEVTSLVNARNTRGEGDTLIVEELFRHWPASAEELAALRRRVLSNPLYVNNLISSDGTFTTIIIRALPVAPSEVDDPLAGFDEVAEPAADADPLSRRDTYLSSDQYGDMLKAISAITARYQAPDFPIYLTGGPVVGVALSKAVVKDMVRLLPLTLLMVVLFLGLLFRRLSGILYPILIVTLSLASTFGLMAALGIPMSNVSSMLSSFLLVVGVADAVHILSIFYQRYEVTDDKGGAIAHALGHSGLAVLMTSVTTATGLLSFAVADVAPIADLGIIAPLGIVLAFIYTVVLLPSLIAIFPVRHRAPQATGTTRVDRLLAAIARTSCTRPYQILAVSLVIAVVAVAGMTRLRFSQNGLKWFKKSAPIRSASELIDDKLRGTMVLEVVIDTGTTNGLCDPQLLNQLERLQEHLQGMQYGEVWIGKASSLDTVIKEINRALHENRQEHYTIPQDRKAVAQELLLFEGSGSDDLEQLVDRDLSMVRCTLKVPFRDAFHYLGLVNEVQAHFAAAFPTARITITGANALYVKMFHNIITTMAKSYLISLSIITVLMMLLIGRIRIGMLSMVPNLLPLAVILGVMGWLDIPLDISTVLIGSIAIGLVVDDTIHFMHNFRRYFEQTSNVHEAVSMTLDTAGRAILVTSIVLAAGFYISMASEMRSSVIYGALIGSTVLIALVADYLVTPALMAVVHRLQAGTATAPTRITVAETAASTRKGSER